MTGKVTIDRDGHNLRVLVDGVPVKSFHEISDDFAHTNYAAYANGLERALPKVATLQDALNKAWHDL